MITVRHVLDAHAVDRAIHLPDTQDLLNVIGHGAAFREVERLASK
jgi:hypothetical protein